MTHTHTHKQMGLSERCQSIEEELTVINNKLSCKSYQVTCVCVLCTVWHATSILIYIIVHMFFHATIVSHDPGTMTSS